MLTLNDVLLADGQLLITPLGATSVVLNYGSVNLAYGRIALVNPLLDMFKTGQSIIYSNVGQVSVTYLNISYFLINASSIKLVAP